MSQAEVDTDNLAMLKELLETRFGELIETFISDSETRLAALSEGLKNADLDLVCNQAHSLKGSCRNLGATPLAELCGELEQQSRAGNVVSGEQQLAAIAQKLAAVNAILKQYL